MTAAPPKTDLTFSTAALELLARVSPRQLQWWDETGAVKPNRERHGKGHDRFYTMEQAVLVMICSKIRQAYSLQHTRQLIAKLKRDSRIRAAITDDSDLFLLVGRKNTRFAVTEHGALRDIVLQNDAFHVIAIHELIRALKSCENPRKTRGRRGASR